VGTGAGVDTESVAVYGLKAERPACLKVACVCAGWISFPE